MIASAAEFVRLRTSADPDEYGRAAREECSIEVWMELIRDHPDMRFWVAQNKTVPVEILECLAADDDPSVRSMVAMKGKLPASVLARLENDPYDAVRMSVAGHKNTPLEVLQRMALSDPWAEVRKHAAHRLEEASS